MSSKRILLSVCFGGFYFAALLIGDARGAGSTFQAGIGHAIFFGTFFFVLTLPLILLLQVGLMWLVRRVLRRKYRGVSILEFLPIIILSLFFILPLQSRSPQDTFTWFVADELPASVRDIRNWHTSGFGTSFRVISFKISPNEFEQVLTRYPYEMCEHPKGVKLDFSKRKGYTIQNPREPLVVGYHYSEPGPGGGLRISIYSNSSRDTVYVVRSYD
jgi:hypothetical protein